MDLLLNPFGKKKPARPYLKVCTKCHGKGQLSSFNQAQDKVYNACDKCTTASDITGLGVTLKDKCQKESAPYTFVRACDVKFLKGLPKQEANGLAELQKELDRKGGGTAILLQCDCGARYLVKDLKTRVKIHGDAERNPEDKEFNKEIAEELVQNGIVHVLRKSPGEFA